MSERTRATSFTGSRTPSPPSSREKLSAGPAGCATAAAKLTRLRSVGFVHTAFKRLHAGFDFRQHAAGDGSVADHLSDVIDVEVADAGIGIVYIPANPVGVGNDDQFFGLHGGRDCAGGGIGVDV